MISECPGCGPGDDDVNSDAAKAKVEFGAINNSVKGEKHLENNYKSFSLIGKIVKKCPA